MIDFITHIKQHLSLQENVWYTKVQNKISYPSSGNQECYQVEDNSFWFTNRNNIIINLISKYAPENNFILDVGGGNGFVSLGLQKNGFDVYLIEPGHNGILNAQERGVNNLICSTLDELFLPANSISSIGIFDVLEHIEKDTDFLKNIYKILSENGYLYLTVPAYKMLWSDEDVSAGHFTRYNISKLRKILYSAGFTIKFSTYFFSLLVIPIFLFRRLPFLLNKKIKNSVSDDHSLGNSILSRIINLIWKTELSIIKLKIKIPFGSSLFIVSQKSKV